MRNGIEIIRGLRLDRVAIGATALLLLTFSACQAPSVETRKEVEAELVQCLPDGSDLPNDWRLFSSGPYDRHDRNLPGRALGGLYAALGPRDDTVRFIPARHEILAHSTEEKAEIEFERLLIFHHGDRLTPWLKLDLSQNGLAADSLRAGCAYFRTGDAYIARKRCRLVARYDRFLSTLDTSFTPGYVSMEEMLQLLKVIDSSMLRCVDALGDRVWGQADIQGDTGSTGSRVKSGVER